MAKNLKSTRHKWEYKSGDYKRFSAFAKCIKCKATRSNGEAWGKTYWTADSKQILRKAPMCITNEEYEKLYLKGNNNG